MKLKQPTKRQVIILIVVAAVIACAIASLAFYQNAHREGPGSPEDRPLAEILGEQGYDGSLEDWVATLPDEDQAAIDIAYEDSVSNGYEGSKEDWLAHEVQAHYDQNGDLTVALPDGGQFSVPHGQVFSDGSGADADEDQQQTDETDAASAARSEEEGSGDSGSSGGAENEGGDTTTTSEEGGKAISDLSALGAALSVDDVQVSPGDTGVAVPVRIERNPGILGMAVLISYDESAMTLTNAENGEAFRDILSLTKSKTYESGCSFAWDGVQITPDQAKDGTILTLYFDISKDAKPGTYPIAVRCKGDAFGNDLDVVGVSVEDGNVVVE